MFEKIKQLIKGNQIVVKKSNKENIQIENFQYDMSNRVNRTNLLFILLLEKKDSIE